MLDIGVAACRQRRTSQFDDLEDELREPDARAHLRRRRGAASRLLDRAHPRADAHRPLVPARDRARRRDREHGCASYARRTVARASCCSRRSSAGFSDQQIARILEARRSRRCAHAARELRHRSRASSRSTRWRPSIRRRPTTSTSPTTATKTTSRRAADEDGHRPRLGRLPHRQLGRVRLVLRERGHDAAASWATARSSSTTTPKPSAPTTTSATGSTSRS